MKNAVALIILLTFAPALLAQDLKHTRDSLATVKENLKAGQAVMVDVRELDEWNDGHLAGAIHLPTSQLQKAEKRAELVKKLDKNKIVYLHCKAGYRALSCGELLKAEGFDVRPLKTGYIRLVEDGLEKAK